MNFTAIKNIYIAKLKTAIHSQISWNNTPADFNVSYVNNCLINQGFIGVFERNGIKFISGSIGGSPTEYGTNDTFILSNPVIGDGNFKIGKDCELIYFTSNDKNQKRLSWLYELIDMYAEILADNLISSNICQKNSRLIAFITATNPAEKATADKIITDMYNGTSCKIVTKSIIDDISVNPIADNSHIAVLLREFREYEQFIVSKFYNDIGINSNFIMKKERMISDEISVNEECLDSITTDIYNTVNNSLLKVNSMFDLNISFNWKSLTKQEKKQVQNE